MFPLFTGFFMGIKWAHNGFNVIWVAHQSSTQTQKAGRGARSPGCATPERPATVKVSYLSPLMTRFDVSPFISEPRSTSARPTHELGVSPLCHELAPFVVNRPKSSLGRQICAPCRVRPRVVPQWSGVYTHTHPPSHPQIKREEEGARVWNEIIHKPGIFFLNGIKGWV